MSFNLNIRRLFYLIFYGRNFRSKRIIFLIGFIFFLYLFIYLKKHEKCFSKKDFISQKIKIKIKIFS